MDVGCTAGLRGASALPRVSPWGSGPPLACPGSPAVAAALASVPGSGRGENWAALYPRPSHFLSFLKKHKTLEIHVLYDGEKKST